MGYICSSLLGDHTSGVAISYGTYMELKLTETNHQK